MRGFILLNSPNQVYNWSNPDSVNDTLRAFGLVVIRGPGGYYTTFGTPVDINAAIAAFRTNLYSLVTNIALNNAEAFRGILI